MAVNCSLDQWFLAPQFHHHHLHMYVQFVATWYILACRYITKTGLDDIFWQSLFGSKFTSTAEGWRIYWLIYDSMISQCACGQFLKSRGLSASVSFLPLSSPIFYPLHLSPCNSLLLNHTEMLATQAIVKRPFYSCLLADLGRVSRKPRKLFGPVK